GALMVAALLGAALAVFHSPHPFVRAAQSEEATYYGFLSRYDRQAEPISPVERLYGFFGSQTVLEKLQQSNVNKIRPMRQWRHWADSEQNALLTYIFTFSFAISLFLIAPSVLRNAEITYRVHSARSFLYGLVVTAAVGFLARAAMTSNVGWPAGIVLLGIL